MMNLLLLSLWLPVFAPRVEATGTDCRMGQFNRRRLTEVDWVENEVGDCGPIPYDVSLWVLEHLFLVNFPKNTTSDCPIFVMEAHGTKSASDDSNITVQKNVWLVDNPEDIVRLKQVETLFLAEKSYFEIFEAFKSASTTNVPSRDSSLLDDIIQQNCGLFLLDMARLLGLPTGAREASFIAKHLSTTPKIANLIRKSRSLTLLEEQPKDSFDLILSNADDNPDHELVSRLVGRYMNPRKALEASCTLCYGDETRQNVEELPAYAGGGFTSCTEAEQLVQQYAAGSQNCTISQVSGYAHCGCPTLPPINNEITCNFCDTPSYDIQLNKIIPQFPPPDTSNNFKLTCFAALNAARFLPDDICQGNVGNQYYCGCPNAPKPPTCTLCIDGNDVPDPDKVILPDGGTCQSVIDLLETGVFDSCGALQATAGVYCDCAANLQQDATFDLPYVESPCRVCNFYPRTLLPDTTIRYANAFAIERLGYEGHTLSCGQVEYLANAFNRCDQINTFFLDDFCACELGEDEDFFDCSLCADGDEPDLEPFASKGYPDIARVSAMTCSSAATEFRTFPPSSGRATAEECNAIRELGFLECGCKTQPAPLLGVVQCEFGCSYQDIPDPFRWHPFYQESCGIYFARSRHLTDQDNCEVYSELGAFCCEVRGATPPSNGCQPCPDGEVPVFLDDPGSNDPLCGDFYENLPYSLPADNAFCPEDQTTFANECGGCRAMEDPAPTTVPSEVPSNEPVESKPDGWINALWLLLLASAVAAGCLANIFSTIVF